MALPYPSLKIITAFCMLFLFAGCTAVPFDAPRSVTHAGDVPKSGRIYHIAQDVERANGGLNSIAPLSSGNDALGVRLRMIEQAEHSLDLQYFLIKPDSAATLISAKLLEAADRGVRVRFLLDDAFTTVKDSELVQLDSHPNIEIRIFNPLSRNTLGFMNYILDFNRVNRRMHNKSIVVDNAMAVIGGRNIADEYFQIGTDTIFADFEMFVVGPTVQDISATFDLFWNDEYAVPVRALYTRDVTPAPDASEMENAVVDGHSVPDIYQHAVNSTYLNDIAAGRIVLHKAEISVVKDLPLKTRTPVGRADRVVGETLYQAMARADKEVLLLTPYFVPQDYGARFFENLAQSGVRVRIVTNSLAATNHAYVHGGYYHHRESLLAAGVELYEIRADAPGILGLVEPDSGSKLTMHTKAVLIDDSYLFVGSLNLDPRSIKINSELGLFFDIKGSKPDWLRDLDKGIRDYTFRLELDNGGNVVWIYSGAGRNDVFRSEPNAKGWDKFVAWVARVLPVEGQL